MIEIKKADFPELKVAYVRHIGSYAECGQSWHKLMSFANNHNLINENTLSIGVGYDNPEEVKECRYDACITIDKDINLEDGIKIQTLPKRKCIMTVHKGSYKDIIETYHKIFNDELIAEYNIDCTAPCVEIYKNSPMTVKEEKDLITEIYVALCSI